MALVDENSPQRTREALLRGLWGQSGQVSHTGATNAGLYLADVAECGHGDADIGAKSVFKSKVTLAECRTGGEDVIAEQDVCGR